MVSRFVVMFRMLLHRPRVLGTVSGVMMLLGVLILLQARIPTSDPAAVATAPVISAPSHEIPFHALDHATPPIASPPSP